MTSAALYTDAQYVRRASDNYRIYLRGVNHPSGFTYSCTGNWYGNGDGQWSAATTFSETKLRQRLTEMQNYGFNALRILLNCDWWLNDESTNLDGNPTSTSCRTAVEATVNIAQEYDIYCIVTPYMADVNDSDHDMPFPTDTFANQAAFVSFWTTLANELKEYPNVLFGLWNEPAGNQNTWLNCAQACISAIRGTGATNLITVQYGYCGDFGFATDARISGTNMVYENHIYFGVGATIESGSASYETIVDTLLDTWHYSTPIDANLPIWIGEVGMESGQSTSFTNTLSVLNDWNVGYAAWEWGQSGSYALQTFSGTSPFLVNSVGQILVDAIESGGTEYNDNGITGSDAELMGLKDAFSSAFVANASQTELLALKDLFSASLQHAGVASTANAETGGYHRRYESLQKQKRERENREMLELIEQYLEIKAEA